MMRLALLLVAARSFAAPASEINLSARISVPQSVFRVEETKKLNVSFTVTNAGTATTDPDINASQLFVNGAVPEGWAITIAKRPGKPAVPGTSGQANAALRLSAGSGVFRETGRLQGSMEGPAL